MLPDRLQRNLLFTNKLQRDFFFPVRVSWSKREVKLLYRGVMNGKAEMSTRRFIKKCIHSWWKWLTICFFLPCLALKESPSFGPRKSHIERKVSLMYIWKLTNYPSIAINIGGGLGEMLSDIIQKPILFITKLQREFLWPEEQDILGECKAVKVYQ